MFMVGVSGEWVGISVVGKGGFIVEGCLSLMAAMIHRYSGISQGRPCPGWCVVRTSGHGKSDIVVDKFIQRVIISVNSLIFPKTVWDFRGGSSHSVIFSDIQRQLLDVGNGRH